MKNTTKAALLSMLGFFLFTGSDTVRKYLLLHHEPTQIQLWVSSFSVLALIVASPWLGGLSSLKRITKPHIHFIKSVLLAGTVICVIFAIGRLQLDVFYTIVFTIPLLTTLLAAVFFKEPLPPLKLGLILLGFAGVVLVARPGTDVDFIGVGLTLILCLCFAGNSLLNKLFSADEDRFPFGFFPYGLLVLIFFVLNGFTYTDLGWVHIAMSGTAGSLTAFGMLALIYAFQIADANVAAPYQYTQLIWGIIYGFVFFGHVPGLLVILGALIIIASGLILFLYDQKQIKKIRT